MAGVGGPRRPGIVHRLDKGTSGLIVLAKTPAAYASLTGQLARRDGLAPLPVPGQGLPGATGACRRSDRPRPRSRVRMAVAPPGKGKGAVTRYRVLERFRAGAGESPVRVPAGDGPHSPDPGAPGLHRPSAARGSHLRSAAGPPRRSCARPACSRTSTASPCTRRLRFVHPVRALEVDLVSPTPPAWTVSSPTCAWLRDRRSRVPESLPPGGRQNVSSRPHKRSPSVSFSPSGRGASRGRALRKAAPELTARRLPPRPARQRRLGIRRAIFSSMRRHARWKTDLTPYSDPVATAVILAAGESTRMRSSRPKVLHRLCGRPLVDYPVRICRALGTRVVLVVGRGADEVRAAVGDGPDLAYVEQKERLGTGHAAMQARGACPGRRRADPDPSRRLAPSVGVDAPAAARASPDHRGGGDGADGGGGRSDRLRADGPGGEPARRHRRASRCHRGAAGDPGDQRRASTASSRSSYGRPCTARPPRTTRASTT